jgi:hypothetical protein
MVFNATFNNISIISWQSVLLVEETGVPGAILINMIDCYKYYLCLVNIEELIFILHNK